MLSKVTTLDTSCEGISRSEHEWVQLRPSVRPLPVPFPLPCPQSRIEFPLQSGTHSLHSSWRRLDCTEKSRHVHGCQVKGQRRGIILFSPWNTLLRFSCLLTLLNPDACSLTYCRKWSTQDRRTGSKLSYTQRLGICNVQYSNIVV